MKENKSKQIEVKIVNTSGNAMPEYKTPGSSGFDLAINESARLLPGEFNLFGTGLYMAIPDGYELQIRPRSGLANKYLLIIPNSPGTVDSDYRGEIKIGLLNLNKRSIEIEKGDRIAQGIICPVLQVNFKAEKELDSTSRGSGGFGSTGI